jgi:hypothetical protein
MLFFIISINQKKHQRTVIYENRAIAVPTIFDWSNDSWIWQRPLWQNSESFHLFLTFFHHFLWKGDKCWSQKGGEKFTHFVKKRWPFGRQNDDKKVWQGKRGRFKSCIISCFLHLFCCVVEFLVIWFIYNIKTDQKTWTFRNKSKPFTEKCDKSVTKWWQKKYMFYFWDSPKLVIKMWHNGDRNVMTATENITKRSLFCHKFLSSLAVL